MELEMEDRSRLPDLYEISNLAQWTPYLALTEGPGRRSEAWVRLADKHRESGIARNTRDLMVVGVCRQH